MDSLMHFDLPFRFGPNGGSAVTVQQDTWEDVKNCIIAIFRTELGTRAYVPQFGVPDLTFMNQPLPLDTLLPIVAEVEPRAQIIFAQNPSLYDELIAEVTLELSTHG